MRLSQITVLLFFLYTAAGVAIPIYGNTGVYHRRNLVARKDPPGSPQEKDPELGEGHARLEAEAEEKRRQDKLNEHLQAHLNMHMQAAVVQHQHRHTNLKPAPTRPRFMHYVGV